MIRIRLTPEERLTLEGLRRNGTLQPPERDRLEMVLLSAAGWSPPRIAAHFGYHAATVRRLLLRFQDKGALSLRRRPPGPPPDAARRQQVTAALDRLLQQDRTWTTAQLAAALAEEGIRLSARQTRRYLRDMDARWRRTVHSLRHKQDAAKVERAKAVLAALKKRRPRAAFASSISTSAASVPAKR